MSYSEYRAFGFANYLPIQSIENEYVQWEYKDHKYIPLTTETDITVYEPPKKPNLVISLHACDTATDIVLESAVRWNADVILSTPCCHHELNRTLACPELSFISAHSMLRQKFCDAATDALRLKKLDAEGYRTEALELVDPEETPKNILLRAVKRKGFDKNSAEAKELLEEYEAARAFLLRGRILLGKRS